ncbi:MAG: PilZ domain-containing protein [Candidatus Omnitrophota bacterium]
MVRQVIQERRQGVRAKRVLGIQYRLVKSRSGQEKNWHLSTTVDMSFVGVSFLSDAAYHPGDVLELRMVMSGVLDIYNGFAQVVRTEKKKQTCCYLVGVKFIERKSRSRKAKTYHPVVKRRLPH